MVNYHRKRGVLLSALLVAAVVFLASVLPAAAATVAVYTEVTYTDADAVAMVYANIDATDGDPVISSGVKLTYSVSELSNPQAEKNEAIWYFGDGGTNNFPYVQPDTSTSGVVIFFLGRLDSTETTQSGVSGDGVLLGTVTFARATSDVPVADPAALFGISASLGRDRTTYPDYVNFASLGGVDLDTGVAFNATDYSYESALVGDLDGNCVVNILDFNIFRANYGATGQNVADLDGNGVVNILDFNIFRANYGQSCGQ